MKVEFAGLGKLDAVELQRLLGDATTCSDDVGRSAETTQDLGTAALLLLTLSPEIIAGVVAWMMKPRRRSQTRLILRSTSEDGRSEELELHVSEFAADGLDPKVLEKLSKITRLAVPALKQAIAKEIGKTKGG